MRLNLRERFSIGVCGLVLGLLAAVLVVLSISVTRAIKNNIKRDLQAAERVVREFTDIRMQELIAQSRMIAEMIRIKTVVLTPELDQATLLDTAKDVQSVVGSELLSLVNASGVVLADVIEPDRFGSSLTGDDAVVQALHGESTHEIRVIGRELYAVVSTPILMERDVVGALRTGFVMDRRIVTLLGAMANCRVGLAIGDTLIAATEDEPLFLAMDIEDSGASGSGAVLRRVDGERFLCRTIPSGTENGVILLARSLDYELMFYRRLQTGLLLVGVGVLVLAFVLSVFTGNKITQPIQALMDGVQRIADGDYAARVSVTSRDELGELGVAFNRMTSELSRSRRELTSAKEYTDNIIRSMADALLVLDVGGTIQSVNHAASSLLDYEEEQLVGKPLAQILAGAEDELAMKIQKDAEHGITTCELLLRTRESEEIPVSFTASALLGAGPGEDWVESRSIVGVVAIARDLREQKRSQSQLLQASKLASIGELAGNLAHEINNPIAVIGGKTRLLLKKNKEAMPDRVVGELEKIAGVSERISRIVSGLLSFGRPSQETRSQVQFEVPLHRARSLVEYAGRLESIEILEEFEPDAPSVTGNAAELEQVFVNLITNASDAMPEGGTLKLRIRHRKQFLQDGRPAVVAEIEDSGTGIDSALGDRIFEPFISTKEDGKGTGLGLSICAGLVRSHEGDILAEPVHPCGTRFIVRLPSGPAGEVTA